MSREGKELPAGGNPEAADPSGRGVGQRQRGKLEENVFILRK